MKPIVIYHNACLDGFTAAWIMWRNFGDSMEYVPGVYQGTVPDVTDRVVYLVDFSYKRDVVDNMLKVAKSVILIDHHKSALEDLWDLADVGLDTSNASLENSGAVLTWNFINKLTGSKAELLKMVAHVEDRDLWKFVLPETKAICAYLYNKLDSSKDQLIMFQEWENLMTASETTYYGIVLTGNALVEDHSKLARESAKYTRPMEIGGYIVPVCNCQPVFSSEVGNILAQTNPFGVTYIDMKDCRNFSFRSDKLNPQWVDVSKIAETLGGGGHAHAAGARVPRDHRLAIC
jgi:oligoribonuclease NrnB/cAMP/cGMP phosphodiesterase (DHH superfamily)